MKATIDKYKIDALVISPILVDEFPFLRKTLQSGGCCGDTRSGPDYDYIKQAVANMPDDRKRLFKEKLGASEVVVYLPGGAEIVF